MFDKRLGRAGNLSCTNQEDRLIRKSELLAVRKARKAVLQPSAVENGDPLLALTFQQKGPELDCVRGYQTLGST